MKQKLLKFLNLSLSQNEHEAFASVKKANELIKREDTTWSEIFKDKESEIVNNNENYMLRRNLLILENNAKVLKEEILGLNSIIKYLVIIIIGMIILWIVF